MTARRFTHLLVAFLAVRPTVPERLRSSATDSVALGTAGFRRRRRQPQQYAVNGIYRPVATLLLVVQGVCVSRENVSPTPRTTWLDRIRITSMASWLTKRFGTTCSY